MLKKILLETNVLPFDLKTDFNTFQSKYITAKKTKNPNCINYVWSALEADFAIWAQCFEKKDYYSNINIYTCLRLLEADNKTPGTLENKITLLEEYLNFFNLNYIDLIQEAFLLHINKPSYIPMYKYSKQKDLQYYIAKEIKMFMFSLFRKSINYQKKQHIINNSLIFNNFSYNTYYFDTKYLESLPLETYRQFIKAILLQEKLNHQSKGEICQLIKILLSSN